MKEKFSEITLHKQTNAEFSAVSCLVELEETDPYTMSSFVAIQKVKGSLLEEFRRLPIGSSLRIMVVSKEREVRHD